MIEGFRSLELVNRTINSVETKHLRREKMLITQFINLELSAHLRDTAFPLADANGNCVSFIDDAGNVQAHYVYDAFGGIISSDGDMDVYFRFRFSSKYLDDEPGLYYYGFRYFSPALGRWLSRDPIGERGGVLLYSFVDNDSINHFDIYGLFGSGSGGPMDAWAESLTKEPCCGGEPYNPSNHCCINDVPVDRTPVDTGVQRCCQMGRDVLSNVTKQDKPMHCWVDFPGGSTGFWPRGGEVSRGQIYWPDDPYSGCKKTDKLKCTPIKLSPCEYNVEGFTKCVSSGPKGYLLDDDGTGCDRWTSNDPYIVGINDCRHYLGWLIASCKRKNSR